MEHTLLILSALLLNAVLGGPSRVYSILGLARLARLPAQGIREIERRLNREHRTVKERVIRGWVFALFVIFACIAFGMLIDWILQDEWQFVEILLLAALLPARSTWKCASAVAGGLRRGSLNEARRALAGTVWRHHARLDEHGVARAAIETLAVHFSDKMVGPALFYLLFGLPGLFVSKSIYLMQETLVRPTQNEEAFAHASQQLHFFLHYIPARIAAMLWLCAAIFLPYANMKEATEQVVNGMFGERPQDVAVLSAAAVLRVSLGGPGSVYVHEGWVGAGSARASQADIRRAQRAFILLHVLLFCFIGLFI